MIHYSGSCMAMPSLAALEVFDAVARQGSFTRAAQELHVTQGAVSHRIRALEDELGVALFVRSPRNVELTDAGRTLAAACRAALLRIRDGIEAIRNKDAGVLTISCSPSFAIKWLVPRLPRLRAIHPGLD